MVTVTSINGKLVDRKNAVLSVFDNSLLYAEGLFETFLAIEDRIIFEVGHLTRLQTGASSIGLRLPVGRRQLHDWMVAAVRKHPARIKKVRLTVTSGESARWIGKQGKPQVIVIVSPHDLPDHPFRLYVSALRVDQDSSLRRIKTLSYVLQAAAVREAQSLGFDDALLLNERNQVAEITSANVFWVKKSKIYTPPLSAGCLQGITRAMVLREAQKLRLNITETDITLDNLLRADELFLSSSLKLVLPIAEISESHRRHMFESGPISLKLTDHFRTLVGV